MGGVIALVLTFCDSAVTSHLARMIPAVSSDLKVEKCEQVIIVASISYGWVYRSLGRTQIHWLAFPWFSGTWPEALIQWRRWYVPLHLISTHLCPMRAKNLRDGQCNLVLFFHALPSSCLMGEVWISCTSTVFCFSCVRVERHRHGQAYIVFEATKYRLSSQLLRILSTSTFHLQ